MAVRTDKDHGTDIYQGAGGPGKPPCQWFYGVCTEPPTKHITAPPGPDGEPNVSTYCTRHYVLTLARHIEVHGPTCEHGVDDHIVSHGDLMF
jgi:hypothetical protein